MAKTITTLQNHDYSHLYALNATMINDVIFAGEPKP